jgi:hypothetical protein
MFTCSTIAAVVAQLAPASISCEPLAKKTSWASGPRTNLDSTTWSLPLKSAAALKALATPEEKNIWGEIVPAQCRCCGYGWWCCWRIGLCGR